MNRPSRALLACTFLSLSILVLTPPAKGQDEGQLWSELGLKYRVQKTLDLRFDQHLRFGEDFSQLDKVMPELGIRLRLGKYVRLSSGYRFKYQRSKSGDFEQAHRIHMDLGLRLRMAKTRLDYRLRLQETVGDGEMIYGLRNRLRFRLLMWDRFTPFISAELFNRFSDVDRFQTNKWRISAGTNIELGDHELDVFYRSELPIRDSSEPTLHILGLGYHFDLSPGKRVRKARESTVSEYQEGWELIDDAVLINPLASVVAAAAGAVPMIDAAAVNLKYHHAFSDYIGLSVEADFGYLGFIFDNFMLGAKFGPRFFLCGQRLEGWYVFPMALAGVSWTTNRAGDNLQTSGILGAGVEMGFAWRFRGFLLELGGGTLVTTFIEGSSEVEGMKGKKPKTVLPIKPIMNLSIGYGW